MVVTSENQLFRHKKYICAGLLAHVDSGKTTLSESILYESGAIRRSGRVDNGDAFLDHFELERRRGITIFSKQAVFRLGDYEVTLVDTPGHVDFSTEMERTLQVLDYAVLVINGADGVQGHTKTLWELCARYRIPVFLFVNKMDQPGTDAAAVLKQLQEMLDGSCVMFPDIGAQLVQEETPHRAAGADIQQKTPHRAAEVQQETRSRAGQAAAPLYANLAVGEEQAHRLFLREAAEEVALCDERLLERYLEGDLPSRQDVAALIRERKLFPCLFGSALKQEGVKSLLALLQAYFCVPEYGGQFGAKIFKINRDEKGERLTHMKITGGSLKVKQLVGKADYGWEEKVDQIRIYSGGSYESVPEAVPGMICAVSGLAKSSAGEVLGIEKTAREASLEPVMNYRVLLPEGQDAYTMLANLRIIEEEDPKLHISWQEETKEIQVQLMGQVQMEVLQNLVKQRFGVGISFDAGSIVYKETILNRVEGVGHFEPLRHYAEVHLILEPGKRGSGLVFASECPEDELDKNWQRLVMTHLQEKRHVGVLAGAEITDMKITLAAGKAHAKHTEGGDFRQAVYRAVRQGLMQAQSRLLEPVYEFQLEVPPENVGRALSDMERLYAEFEPPEVSGELAVISGTAPVAAMQEYRQETTVYTHGKGRLFCRFAGYRPCHNEKEVLEEIHYDPDRDLENPSSSVFCAHGGGYYVEWDKVPEYMHLPAVLENWEPDRDLSPQVKMQTKSGGQAVSDSWSQDKELEEIFKRTFGETSARDMRRPVFAPVPKKETVPREEAEEYLLVDGYNVIFSWEELQELAKENIEGARGRLMDCLSNYQGYKNINLILVFDAYRVEGHEEEVFRYHNISVVYTKEAETADQYIEKTAHKIGRKYHVTVATSDGLEQVIIRGQGCDLLSSRELKQEIEQMEQELRENYLSVHEKSGAYLFEAADRQLAGQLEAARLGKSSITRNQ